MTIPTKIPSVFLLVSSILMAQAEQQNLPMPAVALFQTPGRLASSPSSVTQLNLLLRPRLPIAFAPQSSGGNMPPPSGANAPNQPSPVRRHRLLLAGLVITGAGAALVATGGPGHSNGSCFTSGPASGLCVPPGPVWLGNQRFAGVLTMG